MENNRYKDDDSIRVGLAGIKAFLVFALAVLNAELSESAPWHIRGADACGAGGLCTDPQWDV